MLFNLFLVIYIEEKNEETARVKQFNPVAPSKRYHSLLRLSVRSALQVLCSSGVLYIIQGNSIIRG